jgi:hypothetical protein
MHAGKNVGEASEAVGLTFDEAFEIFRRHMITGYLGLEKKVKE